jgi:hypothetical protein
VFLSATPDKGEISMYVSVLQLCNTVKKLPLSLKKLKLQNLTLVVFCYYWTQQLRKHVRPTTKLAYRSRKQI